MEDKNTFIRDKRGFSLVELLIFSLLLLLVLSAVYIVLFGAVSSCETGESIAEINQNARMAIDRMVSELRESKEILNNSTETKVYFLNISDTTKLYSYSYSNKRLYYGLGGNIPLADYVSGFSLTYYQDSTTLAADFGNANRVKIEMEIEKDGIRRSFSSSAQLRNK